MGLTSITKYMLFFFFLFFFVKVGHNDLFCENWFEYLCGT